MAETAMATVTEVEAKAKELNLMIKEFMNDYSNLVINTDEEAKRCVEAIGIAKDRLKEIDNLRKNLTAPYNAKVKEINNLLKGEMTPLENFETNLKKALTLHHEKQMAKAEEERKKEQARIEAEVEANRKQLEEASKNNDLEAKTEAEEKLVQIQHAIPMTSNPTSMTRGGTSSASYKKIWKFDLVNLEEVPREFLTLDEKKVRQAIGDGTTEIAGLKIYQETSIAIR